MADDEARFSRRLGLLFLGRWDWWNLKGEHTPYEWALQRIADQVEPLGPDRDDMRAARNTLRLVQLSDEETPDAVYDALKNYLLINQPEDDRVLMPDEAEAIKRGKS